MSHDPLAVLDDDAVTDAAADVQAAGDGVAVLNLDSSLTVAETAGLQEILLAHVRSMTPLRIDAADVETIDTAGLQLIAALYKTGAAKGLQVTLQAPSERFTDAASRIGLGALFGLRT
ncbi:MAG: STAS domain-containing protein [Gammaproteobacteria bacterium]|nr:STAS domain-containing protein [Gammaproteobacteria bacterium]